MQASNLTSDVSEKHFETGIKGENSQTVILKNKCLIDSSFNRFKKPAHVTNLHELKNVSIDAFKKNRLTDLSVKEKKVDQDLQSESQSVKLLE